MSQSKSLKTALDAVERVLSAETGDLKALAEIAGVPTERLFLGADLSGLDLRAEDVEFLVPLQTNFHAAQLTQSQRRAFVRADRTVRREKSLRKELDVKAELVSRFIDHYANEYIAIKSEQSEEELTRETLISILLKPLSRSTGSSFVRDAVYINGVLSALSAWATQANSVFFAEVFHLLGLIECHVNKKTVDIVHNHWAPIFKADMGDLIAAFRETSELDCYWIVRSTPSDTFDAASQINNIREISADAIEAAVNNFDEWRTVYEFLVEFDFDCSMDQAERIAVHITRKGWNRSQTRMILELTTHPRVRGAIFRQLLNQRDEGRLAEIVRWLDDDRGAAGALSLENALSGINDFELAFRLAKDLAPNLAENQMSVVIKELTKISGDRDTNRLTAQLREIKARRR